jgi:hypothetical protein
MRRKLGFVRRMNLVKSEMKCGGKKAKKKRERSLAHSDSLQKVSGWIP